MYPSLLDVFVYCSVTNGGGLASGKKMPGASVVVLRVRVVVYARHSG